MANKKEINVGDVVTITRGKRYPPTEDDSIGIVIEEMPTVDGFEPIFVVMWNGQMDGLPERRLKKLDKTEHVCTKLTPDQLNYIHNQQLT